MASPFAGPTAVADVIKDVEMQIALIGLGPHNPKKKQDLDKLYDLQAKAQQIMNQFGPSTLINLSNFSSIKPEPASTPPQSSMANSTTVAKMPGTPSGGGRLSPESNQVLTKKKLQDLVREVDPNEQLDEDVEEFQLLSADRAGGCPCSVADAVADRRRFHRERGDGCLPARPASQVQHPGGEGRAVAPRASVEHVDPGLWL
ncbi:transcription initiation factor TFIID subunit 12 isoform X2 [Anser cygnoides]|uniref:transcription initiation factor TFIID subunit 12 isoform X2 n=1 Tax=Anser cygnoides TaxID=8845 RepID=UPI0034D26477